MAVLTKNTTMEEWCSNGQGGYIAWRLAQFMFFASTGKTMSDEEAKQIVQKAAEKARASKRG